MCGYFLSSFLVSIFLHPNSHIPLLYLLFPQNLFLPGCFAVSSRCSSLSSPSPSVSLSSSYLPLSPPIFLHFCHSSLSLPWSLPSLVLSRNPGSHLIFSLHVVMPTMTKKQGGLTFSRLVAIFTTSPLPQGFQLGHVSARQQAQSWSRGKRQATDLPYLPWVGWLAPSIHYPHKFKRSTLLSHVWTD